MAVVAGVAERVRFGEFELDPSKGQLRHRGKLVPLEPKAFDVLAHLVRNRDRTVSVSELLRVVWPEVAVERGSVHRAVHFLRRAVSDRSDGAEAIQTIPRRGYRFTIAVEEGDPEGPSVGSAAAGRAASYIGRARLSAVLDARLAAAVRGRPDLVLLHGPAGIGKSATLAHLAESARSKSATVFEGRCIEGPGAPPYRPWSRILLAALRVDGAKDVATGLELGLEEVARALPDLGAALGVQAPKDASIDPGARHRVHEAIAEWVRNRCRRGPLVLMIDDLHRADLDSIQLLAFLVQELSDEPLLIAAAFRDGPRDGGGAALESLVSLRPGAPLRLGELSKPEVAELAQAHGGATWTPDDLDQLADSSGGNPLFVEQLLRTRDAGVGRIPDRRSVGLRGALRRLLEDAPSRCTAMLSFASVFGREFDPVVVAAGLEQSVAEVEAAVEEAIELRVLEPNDDGSVRFVHGLIPEVLHAGLSAAERVENHRRAVVGLVSTRTGPREVLSELAHHACEAVKAIGVGPAFDYTVTAARDAMQRLAYDEAVQLFERALSLRAAGSPGQAARATCLIDLATVMVLRGAGREARPRFFEACDLAREIDDPVLLGRAALGPSEVDEYWELDHEQIAVLKEAVELLGDLDPALRVKLLIALAKTGYYSDPQLSLDATEEALELARALGDPSLVCASLVARADGLGWTDGYGDCVLLVDEANQIARRSPVTPMVWGSVIRQAAYNALAAGDREGFESRLRDLEHMAHAHRLTFFDWAVTAMRGTLALLEGRFDDARGLTQQQLKVGGRSNPILAFQAAGVQTTVIQLATGSPEEVAGTMRSFTERFPEVSPWRATLAMALAEIGERDAAINEVDALIRRGFEPRHRDFLPIALGVLGQTVRLVGDRRLAEAVSAELERLPDRCIVVGLSLATYGAVDRYRGLCAETLGNLDEAISLYESGLRLDEAMGAHPFVASGLADLGRALRARGGSEDERRANRHLLRGRDLAGKLGMHRLAGSIER